MKIFWFWKIVKFFCWIENTEVRFEAPLQTMLLVHLSDAVLLVQVTPGISSKPVQLGPVHVTWIETFPEEQTLKMPFAPVDAIVVDDNRRREGHLCKTGSHIIWTPRVSNWIMHPKSPRTLW